MMHDMGDGWHWGFGYGHWFFGLLIWLVIGLMVLGLLKYLFGSRKGD